MKYVFGNWKMYLDFDESNILANGMLIEKFNFSKVNLAVFPSALAAREVTMSLEEEKIETGPQDVTWFPKGGYTGAISAQMFRDIGCKYALVGHSERRHVFGETNDEVRKKMEACLEAGLVPVLCIGETEEDKKEDKKNYRLKKQLMKALDSLDLSDKEIIVAYEPVWAIGTGNACNPDEADETHAWIKSELKNYSDKEIPVLYGGSVNSENVVLYVSRDTVDGVLVGGASTKLETFLPLIHAVEEN